MKKLGLYLLLLTLQLSTEAQSMIAEDYYVSAFNEMSDMLAGRRELSIKRAVYLAEWAYYEGNLDYKADFCDEIDRIVKQMALNEYFFRPYSGNQYKPYTYDFESFSKDQESWECQFVSKVLKTHYGQCRSLPWLYKILSHEIDAKVYIAQAPRHYYIMYKDEDKFTPEDWINLELTTHQMIPSWCIKQNFEICDSALQVGTYMTPMTEIEIVACQMSELAFGYKEKFNRYDGFTFYCVSRSLEFYPMNPNAWIIRGKSLECMFQNYYKRIGYIIDDYAARLLYLIEETTQRLNQTHMTEETEEIRERRKRQAEEAQKYTQENLMPK